MRRYVLVAIVWIGLLLFGAGLSGGLNQLINSMPEISPPQNVTNLCPEGWDLREKFRITGYYAPQESEFPGPTANVIIDGKARKISADFLKEVDDYDDHTGEGWGQTREGDFIGRYGSGGEWISSVHPLDATGRPLKVGTVAVDPAVIAFGSKVKILTLPKMGEIGSQTVFRASDEGDSVKGRHIDIYTGAGAKARQAMFSLTSRGRSAIVCVQYKS